MERTGRRGHAWCAAVALVSLLVPTVTEAAQGGSGRRVALVVGNDAYTALDPLRNAVNDARAVTRALRGVGFTVTLKENATRAQLEGALADFAESLSEDDVALFYFAGHGVQVEQVNYLLSAGYAGNSRADLRLTALPAAEVVEMLRPARVAMLVLDACRNTPAAYRGVRASGGGLAPMEPRGTLIAYAAGAGQPALDALAPGSRNGLFTGKLVEALRVPGLTANELFRQVRREVSAASDEKQRPAVYDDLDYPFYFRPPPATATAGGGGGTASSGGVTDALESVSRRQENLFWQSVESNPTVARYEAYLAQYPNGAYAALARLALADPPRPRPAVDRPGSRPSVDPAGGRRDGEVFRDCGECPQMVVVPGGRFTMGSPGSEEGRYGDEGPQHRVTIPAIAVGVYEVTFAEWEACVSAGGCGGYRPNDWGWGRGSRPVINVSWEDAQAYVSWLSRRSGFLYRLLSESEWEYVARAGTTTRYWWGDSVGRDRANCGECGSGWDGEMTAPVGSFSANRYGLHDVSGNVWEWVEDCWHGDYVGAPSDGSAWTSGGDCSLRVLRGGSWSNYPRDLRSASRLRTSAGLRLAFSGFCVSRTLD